MMRKRAHTSCNDMQPQLKCHIGEREVNMGVNKDENLQVVYAKTLEKLFKASQKKEANDTLNARLRNTTVPECDQYKQMFLDSKCQLKTQGCMMQSSSEKFCGHCNRSCVVERDCSFCEKLSCEYCSSYCKRCGKPFCSLCMFVMYEGSEEFSVCRWCY